MAVPKSAIEGGPQADDSFESATMARLGRGFTSPTSSLSGNGFAAHVEMA